MIQILCEEKESATRLAVKLTLKKGYLKAEVEDGSCGLKGFDVIEDLLPYNSYALASHPNGVVKIYRKIYESDYQWLDLNRLGVAIRMDFGDIVQLHGTQTIIQVDTGVTVDEMVIRLFNTTKDNLTIVSDHDYELSSFNGEDLVLGEHPRFSLWDNYSLTTGDIEFKANRKGYFTEDTTVSPIPAADVIDFTIAKYASNFTDPLTRDIDNEEVFVDSSIGVVDNRRIKLENGVGHFRLFTFGCTGTVKLKLGRKWYEVWNDYALTIQ